MSSIPPSSVTERFRAFINAAMLVLACRVAVGLPQAVAGPLGVRLCRIRARFLAIVARLAAGRPTPVRAAPVRAASPRRGGPRPASLLPRHRGWLRPLLPTEAAPLGGHLLAMLHQPEMVALIEAAPASLGRDLRSLCWMLALTPPPHLAPPRRPVAPKPPKPPKAKPPLPPPDSPLWRTPSVRYPRSILVRPPGARFRKPCIV